jgi:hypothetical protein
MDLQAILGVVAGVALAAACGFRVFVPLLVASIAVHSGAMQVSEGFAWIGSTPALCCLAAATAFEIGGYYLPGVDHFLDVIATPAAVVAGTLVTASFVTDMEPWMRWSTALIAGGGAAAAVQGATVVARSISGLTTFGVGNPIVSTAELVGSTAVSILAVVAPILALALIAGVVWWLFRRFTRRKPAPATEPSWSGSPAG